MKKKVSMILAAMVFAVGAQGVVSAAPALPVGLNNASTVMLDEYYSEEEDVTLIVDEPVESGDVLVDEDGEEWVVQ